MPKLEKIKVSKPRRRKSVWKGPEEDGITQSLLSRFLCCRERFRLLVVEGLKPVRDFNIRLDYGSMWHQCEEAIAEDRPWEEDLADFCRVLCRQFPVQQQQIEHWYNVCKLQFPIYVRYWSKHPDVRNRLPLLQEEVFDIPYKLPSGRTVRLRGKWDAVDLIKSGRQKKIWLQENKSKGDIDEDGMKRSLTFDLQTMFYLIALQSYSVDQNLKQKIGGVRYNVIRRPLSGGKFSISQSKGRLVNAKDSNGKPIKGKDGKHVKIREGVETQEEFYDRLKKTIEENTDFFFMRWKVDIGKDSINLFRLQFLDPILEQLWDWWEDIAAHPDDPFSYHPGHRATHFRFPFGVYNPTLERRASEVDEYLISGSKMGLHRTSNLFPELDDAQD